MFQEIAAVLGQRAASGIATSALPCAPVRPVPQRQPHLFTRRLLSVLPRRRLQSP